MNSTGKALQPRLKREQDVGDEKINCLHQQLAGKISDVRIGHGRSYAKIALCSSAHSAGSDNAVGTEVPPSPVYHATTEEFDDPYEFFIKLHAKYGKTYGVVLIKPPESWLGPWKDLGDPLKISSVKGSRAKVDEEKSASVYRIWRSPSIKFRPRYQHISHIGGLRRQDAIFEKKLRLIRFLREEPLPACAEVPCVKLGQWSEGKEPAKRLRLSSGDEDAHESVRVSLFAMFNSWREHRGDWFEASRAALRMSRNENDPRVVDQVRRIYDAWLKGFESYISNPQSAIIGSNATQGDIKTTAEPAKVGDTFRRVRVNPQKEPVKYITTILRRDKKMMLVENVPEDKCGEKLRDCISPNELLFLKANGTTWEEAECFGVAAEDHEAVALCEACCRMLPSKKKDAPHVKCVACECSLHLSCLLEQHPKCKVDAEMDWFCPRCIESAHRDTSLGWLSEAETGFGFETGSDMTMAKFVVHNDMVCTKIFGRPDPDEAAVEQAFWDVVNCGPPTDQSPYDEIWYGNDIDSSLVSSGTFPCGGDAYCLEEGEQWSLRTLPLLPDSVLNEYLPTSGGMPLDITGVTRPWVYLGSALSAFCWHAEDQYLYSINYNHAGSSKIWYSIPGRQAVTMDDLFRRELPMLCRSTPDLTQHMTTMLDPRMLLGQGLMVTRAVQRPGDIILTFPGAYHGGLNSGINLAEAVNVPARDWITMGSMACRAYTQLCRRPIFCFDELVLNICRSYASGEEMHPLLALQAIKHLRYLKKQRTGTPKAIPTSPKNASDILFRVDPDKPWIIVNTSRARRTVSPLSFNYVNTPSPTRNNGVTGHWYGPEVDGAICSICRQFCSIVAGECRDCGLVYCNLHIGLCCTHPGSSKTIHSLLDCDDVSKLLDGCQKRYKRWKGWYRKLSKVHRSVALYLGEAPATPTVCEVDSDDLEYLKSEGELTPTRPERRAKQNAMESWKRRKKQAPFLRLTRWSFVLDRSRDVVADVVVVDSNSTLHSSSSSSPRSALALRVDMSTISAILEERETEGIPWRSPGDHPPNAEWLAGLKERCADPWKARLDALLEATEPLKYDRLFDLLNDVVVHTTPIRCQREEDELIRKLTLATNLRGVLRSILGMKALNSKERGIHTRAAAVGGITKSPTAPSPSSNRMAKSGTLKQASFILTGTHESLGKFQIGHEMPIDESLSKAQLALAQATDLGVSDLPEEALVRDCINVHAQVAEIELSRGKKECISNIVEGQTNSTLWRATFARNI
ncbi:hypothetical protein FOL47_000009 [Perkinsus chesapeaki]|uniref:Uncharacterized protein n=1 Tax=Perkinsus chesapeaki TaxID=330153 RepID=A0A7J6N2Y5_PERCH|nr:hypothetical protein FOL47_000009 [Perkinsus chesapeaki]